MSQKLKVIVIGAGVSGITTALILQRNGYQVRILAEHFPGDSSVNYSSPWAGADWRPELTCDPDISKFETISFKTLWNLSNFPETGLMRSPSVVYLDKKQKIDGDPWFKNLVPKFIDAGGKLKKVHLSHINEALDEDVDVVVNCTGIGARTLGGIEDKAVFPTRGQTVIVWAPHIKNDFTREGTDYITYIIPRQDGVVVLGGVMGVNDYNEKPEQKTAESIIQRCTALCPELTLGKEYLQIISNNVGRRPSRTGGLRIESE
ncbi:4505_t:CDS:2, partial [Acaulospora colombiana]